MGIRFFCPQGHKLNVKSFLAGKTGFCPYCNAKIEIPLTSTRESTKKNPAAESEPEATDRPTDQRSPTPNPNQTVPVAQPVPAALPVANGQPGVPLAVPVNRETQDTGASSVATQPQLADGNLSSVPAASDVREAANYTNQVPSDPIAEAPQATWYVRPANGGQFGPATGDIMRQWLDEGRVAPDSLVWREGWPDWRISTSVFAKFGQTS